MHALSFTRCRTQRGERLSWDMTQPSAKLRTPASWRVRGWSVAGAVLISTVLWLGIIWPSIFTIVALLIAPALFLFLTGVFWPRFYEGNSRVRLYLRVCLLLAAACWGLELGWLWFFST